MPELLEGVKPTRMELLTIRKRKELAEKGHKLLSEKRDALVSKFFEIIEKRGKARKEMEDQLQQAFSSLIKAQMVMGEERVKEISLTTEKIGDIEIGNVNVMGVKIPKINAIEIPSPSYSFIGTSSKIDECFEQFSMALRKILELTEAEGGIQCLSKEIGKVKRRVNALEHIFLPKLEATIKYIEMQLEEREREDFFRRKRMKALMEK
jgi:V/A-type H+-transporting ATPase subunit D